MEIEDIDTSNFVDVSRYNKDMKSIDNISSDISDMLDASVKTSSIVDNGISVNNLSDILEYLNNVIPLIQKSNISSNKKLLASLEDTRKELLKNKIIGAELKNSSSITAPLVAVLNDILKQLREERKLDINIPESNITVSPTPVTVEAPIVNIPAPIVNIPAPIINIPESPTPIVNVDLDKLTNAMAEYLKPLIYNTEVNPLAVRLSDGDKWIDELKVLTGKMVEQAQYIPNSMFIKNSGTGVINPATEESVRGSRIPLGDASNGTVDLTSADTWYAVPSTVPTSDYVLIAVIESASGTVRMGFSNSGTPSATNGVQAPSIFEMRLAANQSVYYASSTAGDDVNWTTKVI